MPRSTIHGCRISHLESTLALRAVVFDYGMVLSLPPKAESQAELLRITGMTWHELEQYYWVDRHAYDRGDLTGMQFWERLVVDAGLNLPAKSIVELNDWDAHMWTTINPEMLAWHGRLKERGLKTGILSNMGDSVLESIERSFDWIQDVDVPIWSFQHNMAKPEAAIYELLLERMGTAGEETLFLDDKLENIEAARLLGIRGIQFSTVEQLRQDLISLGYDLELPLP